MLPLPSKRTIMSLLNRIPIKSGFNEASDHLEAKVYLLKLQEKLCVIMFDEISVESHTMLNAHIKEFEGFEDFGDRKTENLLIELLSLWLKE